MYLFFYLLFYLFFGPKTLSNFNKCLPNIYLLKDLLIKYSKTLLAELYLSKPQNNEIIIGSKPTSTILFERIASSQ